jgi:aminoglycoside 3-N-acetyltransferase
MHSSLSALGQVEGGAESVVDALFEVLGPGGTLLVPGFRDSVWGKSEDFTCSDCDCSSENGLCPSRQPGFQGVIAETVRQRTGSLRSCHPSHSWVGLGPKASALLRDHRRSPTPCGPGNPFEALVRLEGCLLVLGVDVGRVTLWHHYEEVLRLPYMGHYWPRERHLNHCVPGRRLQYEFPGILQEVARAAGILKTGPVGKSVSGLMRAKDFDHFMATVLADDPFCLVLRPPNRESGDLAVDALHKAARMLEAWRRGPPPPPRPFPLPPRPVPVSSPGAPVRADCPAFAGRHDAGGISVALCQANDRHPELFRRGGIFNSCGVATCAECSWAQKYPPSKV